MDPQSPHPPSVAVVLLAAAVAAAPLAAAAAPVEHRDAAVDGADRILYLQFENGSTPWFASGTRVEPVTQGITAQGLLEAFKVSGNTAYLGAGEDGAAGTRHWLGTWMQERPSAYVAPANVYFLADYAVLTGDPEDMALARSALQRDLALADDGNPSNGPPAADLARSRILLQKASGFGSLGLWNVAHLVRAAHDVGEMKVASTMTQVLATQDLVDPFGGGPFSVYGLSGLVLGLAENNTAAHPKLAARAHNALAFQQRLSGAVPDPSGRVLQPTAYAALSFAAVGDMALAHLACDWLARQQDPATGAWHTGAGNEFVEAESEAVQALVACTAPTRNAATTHADRARSLV